MLGGRIRTSLSSELALHRIRASLGEAPAVHGEVEGRRFHARRAAAAAGLRGELSGVVEPRDGGATIRTRARGANGAAALAGAGLAAAWVCTRLLGDTGEASLRFALLVVGACCLGLSCFGLASVLADWRFLRRHLEDAVREEDA